MAGRFIVASWNVLHDKYCLSHPENFHEGAFLDAAKRKAAVDDQIKHCGADIIALQEWDLADDLNRLMDLAAECDYAYVTTGKPPKNGKPRPDGTAIMWNTSKFRGAGAPLHFMTEQCSATTIALQQRSNGRYIVVTTCHILGDPEREGDAADQMTEILDQAASVHCASWDNAAPHIIMGDFNWPVESLVYNAATQHPRFVFEAVPCLQPTYHTHNQGGKVIDHILYTPQQLIPEYRRLDNVVNHENVQLLQGPWPTRHVPSDHRMIHATFDWSLKAPSGNNKGTRMMWY